MTRNGYKCQPWTSQSPQKHSQLPTKYPKKGLTSNYCRNPDNSLTIWCYTLNPRVRFDWCDPKTPVPTVVDNSPLYPDPIETFTPIRITAGWSTFFKNNNQKKCPITKCTLKYAGCTQPYTGNEVKMSATAPW